MRRHLGLDLCRHLHKPHSPLGRGQGAGEHPGDSRRLVSKFRCGCHGLHVDTDNFKHVGQKVDRDQRFCLACGADTAEVDDPFVSGCPVSEPRGDCSAGR